MPDVAIVIGHHPDAPGAGMEVCGDVIHEYDFWQPFARELAITLEAAGHRPVLVHRPNHKPDDALVRLINETKARCAIELHFNGAEDPAAHGTEMLHWHSSERGRSLADLLADSTADALDTIKRRVSGRVPIDGGFPFLQGTTMPAVICEPAFGTNLGDAWALLTRQADLMQAYRNAIIDFLR